MIEIEGKILDVNPLLVEERLKALGATKKFSGKVSQEVYAKDGFSGHYRIREMNNQIIVTLKTKTGSDTARVKVRDEREKLVESKEQAIEDAKALGFSYRETLTKERIEYEKDKVFFCLDTYPDIPTFLEIEGPSEEIVLEWAKKLGFNEDDVKPWGMKKIIQHYER